MMESAHKRGGMMESAHKRSGMMEWAYTRRRMQGIDINEDATCVMKDTEQAIERYEFRIFHHAQGIDIYEDARDQH